MEKLVFKFLDGYIGGGINVSTKKEPYFDPLLFHSSIKDKYVVKSDNDTIILYLHQNRIGGVNAHYSFELLDVMSNMFSESKEQCREYVRSWFCKRYKINDYRELLSIQTTSSM